MRKFLEWVEAKGLEEEITGASMQLNPNQSNAFRAGNRVRHRSSSVADPKNGTVRGRVMNTEQGHVGFGVRWDSGEDGHHHPDELAMSEK